MDSCLNMLSLRAICWNSCSYTQGKIARFVLQCEHSRPVPFLGDFNTPGALPRFCTTCRHSFFSHLISSFTNVNSFSQHWAQKQSRVVFCHFYAGSTHPGCSLQQDPPRVTEWTWLFLYVVLQQHKCSLNGKACPGPCSFLSLFPRQLSTQTHANTCLLLIFLLGGGNIFIYQWNTQQLLEEWKTQTNFSQRNSQQESIQETLPCECRLGAHALGSLCIKISST